MLRHAWLIIAHNEFEVLQRLVSMLDAPESDFYIHFDKKVRMLPEIQVKKGKLTILKHRIDVRWGTISQIKTEFALFESATQNAPYSYYHIISGTTLPLKSLEEIDRFLCGANGKSVVSGMRLDDPYQETLKLRRYNLFLNYFTARNQILRKTSQFLWKTAIASQRILNIQTNSRKTFYKASNWLSLSQEAVEMILSRKEEILKTYRWSFCGDEFFIPSELMNSPLQEKVFNCENYLLHSIGRANSNSYHLDEWERFSKSTYLFARKFTAR